jgi:O-antigen/teichoic acid export membrane protein
MPLHFGDVRRPSLKLAKHTLLNLLGLGAPLVLAVFLIPPLVRGLGTERFGLLTLIWAATSYFGLFDLGLGRALTQQLAVVLDRRDAAAVGPLCGTALVLMLALGVVGGILMALAAPWAVDILKAVPDRNEVVAAGWVMALSLPFIVATAGLRGMLEACHAFEALNAVRLPLGLWTFAGPWLVLQSQGADLFAVTLALALGRVVGCVAHAWLAWRALPQLRGRLRPEPQWIRPLVTSGGWLTVSNVVSPLMGYVDRFLIGATMSAAAVAFYATPQEIVTKLWIVPGALTAVLFPAFAAQAARKDETAWALYDRALRILFVVLLPVTLGLGLFAAPLLRLWISAEFAQQSALVLQVFSVGILINCMAHVPLTWLHGAGRFRIPALLHCMELPLFLMALWLLIPMWGLIGAAIAWLGRMLVDAAALFWLCRLERLGAVKAA